MLTVVLCRDLNTGLMRKRSWNNTPGEALVKTLVSTGDCLVIHREQCLPGMLQGGLTDERGGANNDMRLVVAAFDWQFCCKARGAYDLAYFLGLACPPEVRRDREKGLIKTYAEALRAGVRSSGAAGSKMVGA